jgi:hypothetical protein
MISSLFSYQHASFKCSICHNYYIRTELASTKISGPSLDNCGTLPRMLLLDKYYNATEYYGRVIEIEV